MSDGGAQAKGSTTAEDVRLREDAARERNWKRWGPYLSERQWGTVREDYSADGSCWTYFPHDHARSRVYRWGEDGLLGITDRQCRMCFAVALWNGKDPILKERLFGLTGPEGNHGEDVKEEYYYLDSTPTHSYMRALYKYPHAAFPYDRLVAENARRGRHDPEFELKDTGVFDESRYFDVFAEYAKASPDDICIRVTIANRGPDAATIHVLPTLWARNTWSWGCEHEGCWPEARIESLRDRTVVSEHDSLGRHVLHLGKAPDGRSPRLLFTDNETNIRRLYDAPNAGPFTKDAFHELVIHGHEDAVNPEGYGSKAAAWYVLEVPAGGQVELRLRYSAEDEAERAADDALGKGFEAVFDARRREADEFLASRVPATLSAAETNVVRQAFAGLLWSKQFYSYVVYTWLKGDRLQPRPAESRWSGRNAEWTHLFNRDVILMPDKWEYPWYASWDLAFHVIALARVDIEYAKEQLILFLREWYMHPNGQLPAYEFALGDVNPPVHAWACWRVYKMTGPRGKRDRLFLERVFHKLMLNFTWWVNRKDPEGKNIFGGGFLGLDNIGVFDRSQPLPSGLHLEQADGTAWMAFYCGTMLAIALELADGDPAYEDVASKFFEHFVSITDAMNTHGGTGLWDEEDGFYYDQLLVHGQPRQLRVRSLVGVVPLLAAEVLDERVIDHLPGFKKRMDWFLEHRKDLARHISYMATCDIGGDEECRARRLLAAASMERLVRTLERVLDESELLSGHGVRSVSRAHKEDPFVIHTAGQEWRVDYTPGESDTALFGGNSNWRGPVWFPLNYLLVETLEKYDHFYEHSLTVECPAGSGRKVRLSEVAHELRRRLITLFLPDEHGHRPCMGGDERYAKDPHYKDLVLFHEYFHGDTGQGLGASHQTGWTALVARLICDDWRPGEGKKAGAPGEQPTPAQAGRG